MSFLIRKVLGQNVVHPPPSKLSSTRNAEDKKDVVSNLQTTQHASDNLYCNREENSTNDVAQLHTKYSSKDNSYSTTINNSNEAALSLPVTTSFDVQNAEESVATATRTPPAPRRPHTHTSTPATTLLLRLQTCTILQDLRDTLQELITCVDLPLIIGPSEFASLVEFLRAYAQDDMMIVETTLHILVNLTDISTYPGSEQTHNEWKSKKELLINNTKNNNNIDGNNSRGDAKRNSSDYSALTINEKRRICDSFTRVLVKHATLLLNFVKRGQHTTQSRIYAIQLLTRLEEFDAAQMHKVLLASHGASVLIDVLVEESNDVLVLRRSVLFLLRSMTMIDTELQTLLAFDNAFEALAQLLDVVGGVNGGDVALECLGIMHNMLRSNRATQKYFREMEYARLLTPLFTSVHKELMFKINSAINTKLITSSSSSSSSSLPQKQQQSLSEIDVNFSGKLPLHEPVNLLQYNKETSTILLLAMAIFSCLLRESEVNHDEYKLTQSNLLECEVLERLVHVAFCGVVADDATRIEALRTITLLIKNHKPAITSFVEMNGIVTVVRSTTPNIVMQWTPLRAHMHYLFTSHDVILLTTTAQLMEAVCTRQECQPRVVDVLLNGFSPNAGADLCNTLNNATSEIPNALSLMRSQYMNDYGRWLANTQLAHCGEVFAWTLFNRMPSTELLNTLPNNSSSSSYSVTHGKYFAVQLLRQLLRMPFMASSLTLLPWQNLESNATNNESTMSAQSTLQPNSNKSKSKNSTTSSPSISTINTNSNNINNYESNMEDTFFHAFASYVVRCLRGEHVQQGMDSATLGAYVETLLVWLKESDKSINILVHSHDGLYRKLLQCARESNAAQLRLYCAVIAAVVCVQLTHITKKASNSKDNKMELEYLTNNVNEEVYNENTTNTVLTKEQMEDRSVLHNDERNAITQPLTQHVEEQEKCTYLGLYEQFVEELGGPAFFDSVLFDINASNSQWAHPAPSAFLIVAHVTYNEEFVQMINQVIEDFRELHLELTQITEITTLGAKRGEEEHNANAQQESILVTNPFTDNVQTGEQLSNSKEKCSILHQEEEKERELEFENLKEVTLQQAQQFTDRDTDRKSGRSENNEVDELREQITKLEQQVYSQTSELKLMHDENERLKSELAEVHMRYTELIHEIENERTNHRTTSAKEEEYESALPQATVATPTRDANNKSTFIQNESKELLIEEIEALRESVHLLEETVNNNEDERQHLLRTIEMMEEQLRSKPKEIATTTAATSNNEIASPPSQVLHATPLHTNTLSVQTEMENKDNAPEWTESNYITLIERMNEMQTIIHTLETERDELLCVLGEMSEFRPAAPTAEDCKQQIFTNESENNNNTNISGKKNEESSNNIKTNMGIAYEMHYNNNSIIDDVNHNELVSWNVNDDINASNSNRERLHQEHPINAVVCHKEQNMPLQSSTFLGLALEPTANYNNSSNVDMDGVEDVENVFDNHTLQTDENPFADEDDGFGGDIASTGDTDFMLQLHQKHDENDLR